MKNISYIIIALCIFNAHLAYSAPNGKQIPNGQEETTARVTQVTTDPVTEALKKDPVTEAPAPPANEPKTDEKTDLTPKMTEKSAEEIAESVPVMDKAEAKTADEVSEIVEKEDKADEEKGHSDETPKVEDEGKNDEITTDVKTDGDDTTTTTTTPSTTTTTTASTTTVDPNTTTTTTTVAPTPSPVPTTTVKPTPDHDRSQFSVTAFIGGMVFAFGMMAIGFIGFKFYKARNERNYHTL